MATNVVFTQQNLIEELVEFNLRSGNADLHKDVQRLLCQLTRFFFENWVWLDILHAPIIEIGITLMLLTT